MTDHDDTNTKRDSPLVPLLSRRDMMDATKEAVKELLTEQVTAFGWWSLKTIALAALSGLFLLWLYLKWGHRG
jgi:hypothetical protein